MNKSELLDAVAAKTGFPKSQIGDTLEAAHDAIVSALVTGADVRLVGFGTYSVKRSEGRKGRNPMTGEEVNIPASNRVKFKSAAAVFEAVNKR